MYAHEPGKIPSKVSRNLRYVQSQNIPEPGVIAAVTLQTSLERLGKAFSVAQTSHLNTLFGVGVLCFSEA